MTSRFIVINNIKLPPDASHEEAFSVAGAKLKKLGISTKCLEFSVFRRSVDARRQTDIHFCYSIAARGELPNVPKERLLLHGMTLCESPLAPEVSFGTEVLSAPPVVVGSGPAGLFSAILLAEHGYAPIILERGGNIAERKRAVKRLNEEHILDENTNIQFGAGGAGTFSDGKLVTRVNDPLGAYILERFIEFGADESIRYIARPHIGTDVLSKVVDRMLARIEELGGRVLYNTEFIRPLSENGRVRAVLTSHGEMPSGALILAVGHSARDTYKELLSLNMAIEAKDFSVGMRIEHLTEDIDRALYGDFAGNKRLGHAEYNLSYDTKNRGVYTFCMCPGGEVVAATSEKFGVVTNGMSNSKRDGANSNSAVLASVLRSDYGATPERAIEFQRNIEMAAYRAAGGEYKAPIITVGDFLRGECIRMPSRVLPSYMNGNNVTLANPESYLPEFATRAIRGALSHFDKRISGFATEDAVLTGPETRTSAPLRILRDTESRVAYGYENFYPSGEGAGYAGGITSAAIDGAKSALALMKKYRPIR